jgi:outer membrane lipoprotein-sorting protein
VLRLVVLLLLASPAFALAQDAGVDPLDPLALSRHLDRLWRADSSEAKVTMKVVTPDYTRTLSLDVWSEGMEHTLIRITAPRKEAGVSTLKRGNEIWNYLPKIKKTIRIPPSMMMGSWMGSDLTNDDLVRESSWEDDYTVAKAPTAPDGQVCLDYTPKPDAAVTWSKVTTCFDKASRLPVTQSFVDEKGREARRMRFEDVKTIGGRTLPTRMIIEPQLEAGRRTEFTYDALEFGVKHPPNTFSITRLRRGR